MEMGFDKLSPNSKSSLTEFALYPTLQPTNTQSPCSSFMATRKAFLFSANFEAQWSKILNLNTIYSAGQKKASHKSKSPDSKSISSQNAAFKQLKKKICIKHFFGPQNNLFV